MPRKGSSVNNAPGPKKNRRNSVRPYPKQWVMTPSGTEVLQTFFRYDKPYSAKRRYGAITGALRAPEPRVFRPYGANTRAQCYPLPDTGILDNVYTWPPVRSHDPPCQLLEGSTPFQEGNPKINEKVQLLRKSSTIWNCLGKK